MKKTNCSTIVITVFRSTYMFRTKSYDLSYDTFFIKGDYTDWNFHYFGIFGESCDFICFLIIFYNTLCLLTQLVDDGRIWCRFDLDMFTQVYDPITDCRLGGYDSYSKKMLLCLYLRGGPKFRFHCFNKIFLYHKRGTHRLFIGHIVLKIIYINNTNRKHII